MCAATSFDVKPLNVAVTCSVWAVGSRTIVARPVPGEGVAGFSFAPERFAVKVIGFAWVAGAGRITPAANASKQEPVEIRGSDSFMFASLAVELGYHPSQQPTAPTLHPQSQQCQPSLGVQFWTTEAAICAANEYT